MYGVTPNDYEGRTQTVAVTLGSPKTISWPTDQDGYHDVVITTTGDGFRRRYAGASPKRRHQRGARMFPIAPYFPLADTDVDGSGGSPCSTS